MAPANHRRLFASSTRSDAQRATGFIISITRTRGAHALTFMYVQTNRQMMPPYLANFFRACYDSWKTKQRPGWLLMRNTEDEHGESLDGRSATGFGESASRRRRARAWRAIP